jgi:two-component system, LytTR family, response regulator
MIRTVIIDDEVNIRTLVREILQNQCPDVEVVAEAGSISASLEAIRKYNPGLVLLDIRLEDGTGFDLLEKISSPTFCIIFITAFEEYALKALRLSAVDYILKPVIPEELVSAIEKARRLIKPDPDERFKVLVDNVRGGASHERKIVLRTSDKFHFVNVGDIIRCESDSSYTTFFFLNREPVIVSKTLKDFEEMLCEFGFYRPHKSYLLNLGLIKAYERSDGGYIIMCDDSKIPLSDKKREEFFRLMERI